MTHPSFSPLRHHSELVLAVLNQSSNLKDPAWFLHKKKARPAFFMVESLTRILLCFYNDDKLLIKGRKKSKKIEDSLGRIEDYDDWYRLYQHHDKVGKKELNYFFQHREKEVKKLNKKLMEHEHYLSFFEKIKESTINFDNEALIKKLSAQIEKELQHAFHFFQKYPDGFNSLENQVHELRRKLRWISIYAQSFDGIIALVKNRKHYSWEKEFHLSVQERSPYVRIHEKKDLKAHIYFNYKAFLALNYVIEELGKIKDKGYDLKELSIALQKQKKLSDKKAENHAAKKLGISYTEKDLFNTAHALLYNYFVKHRLHELLLIK